MHQLTLRVAFVRAQENLLTTELLWAWTAQRVLPDALPCGLLV
jgi:hypothetical protein